MISTTTNDELAKISDPIARARCEALREVVDKLDLLIAEQRAVASSPLSRLRTARAERLLGDLQAACAEEKLKGLIEAAELAMALFRREADAARELQTAPANGANHDGPQGHQVEQLPAI